MGVLPELCTISISDLQAFGPRKGERWTSACKFFPRRRTPKVPPFWVVPEQPIPEEAIHTPAQQDQSMQFDKADLDTGSEVDDGENATGSLYEAMKSKLSRIHEFPKTESEFPGDKCVKKLLETIGVSMDTFLDDVKNKKCENHELAWTKWKHPASLYINSC